MLKKWSDTLKHFQPFAKVAKSLPLSQVPSYSRCRRSHAFARERRDFVVPRSFWEIINGRQQRFLTDRFLRSLPPAKRRQRVEVWDTIVPGFGIRVYDAKDDDPARRGKAGKISFILYARFSPGAAPARRIIGVYPAISWRTRGASPGSGAAMIARGIDPRVVEAAEREKAEREAALRIRHSFAAVAEDFITDKLSQERSGKVTERDLRNIFIAAWGDRPISEITTLDVLDIINAKKRTAPKMAGASAGPHQAVLRLGDRSARLRPDRVTVRPIDPW